MAVWLIVGASRGIGLEYVRQLLARGHHVLASVRDPVSASQLWAIAGSAGGRCRLFECDVASETSIGKFVEDLVALRDLARIEHVVLNAGILQYPNRASEVSYDSYMAHLRINTVGPVITAQKLIQSRIPVGSVTFISSESGSATRFRAFEDGFAAFSSSKAGLHQMIRHLAAELPRAKVYTTILAIHPGEVTSDVGDMSVGWDVEGLISPRESVTGMVSVIEKRTFSDTGTFWTYQGVHPW